MMQRFAQPFTGVFPVPENECLVHVHGYTAKSLVNEYTAAFFVPILLKAHYQPARCPTLEKR
jgi:hypothetical protein